MPSSDQEQSSSDDLEAADQDIPKRITFDPEGPRERSRFGNGSRRRSASRDSISSVRSRARAVQGIPIEFRTLSFQISDSQAIQEAKPSKKFLEERKRKQKVEEVERRTTSNTWTTTNATATMCAMALAFIPTKVSVLLRH
jgi:hypothetical protein